MHTIHTPQAPAAIGPYSQAVCTDGFVFTSGQIPLNPATGQIVQGDIRVQARQVMENLKAVLEAAGSNCALAVKTTCFLAEIADFGAFNEVYGEYFTEKPARSCFSVKELPKGALVEVEVIARTSKNS